MLAELLGRAVCAGDPAHGLPGVAHALPLCARCAGMHLAVAAGWLAWRRRGAATPARGAAAPLLAAAALVAPMGADVAAIRAGLWPGDGWVRTATGLLAGLGIALGLRVAEALGTTRGAAVSLPVPSPRELLAGGAATALALLVPLYGPPAAGAAVTGLAVVASASLAIFVLLRTAAGGPARATILQRAASVAVAAGALVLLAGR